MCSAAPRTFNKLWKFPKHKYPCWTASRTPCSRDQGDEWIISIRGGVQKKTVFLGDLFQMWVGRVADSQTRPNPLENPPNHRKNCLFRPEFHLLFSQITKTLGWGGWVGKQIWENFPKKTIFNFYFIFLRPLGTDSTTYHLLLLLSGHTEMMQGLSAPDKKTFQERISNASHHATYTLPLSSNHHWRHLYQVYWMV